MSDATTPVILAGCRTPIGKYLGGLGRCLAGSKDNLRQTGAQAAVMVDPGVANVFEGQCGEAICGSFRRKGAAFYLCEQF